MARGGGLGVDRQQGGGGVTSLGVPSLDRYAPAEIADLLTSGFTGMELAKRLHAHFPGATRGDVYMACGLAACLWAADLTISEMENSLLRKQGGDRLEIAA
jgi:hypothetical protein